MNKIQENNQVVISGEIVSEFTFNHEVFGEKFYLVDVKVQRLSNVQDILPVMVSDRLISVSDNLVGTSVCVSGSFRSFNRQTENGRKLLLSIFAREILLDEPNENENKIYLSGYICKQPTYRKTPLGREITDVLLAVNRSYGKSDYIPCIFWGRNATYAGSLDIGTELSVIGRIQSRTYIKKLEDGQPEERIAYEVSVSKLEVVSDEK